MLSTYFKDLTEDEKAFAIQRISNRTAFSKSAIKKALENKNPLVKIENEQVVINRNSYRRLIKEAEKLS